MHRQGQNYRQKHKPKRLVEFHNHLHALTRVLLVVLLSYVQKRDDYFGGGVGGEGWGVVGEVYHS